MGPIILPRISDQKPLVSVVSITYNHEPYIRDCLEGFLLQKANFPVEVIIHDDASTDHTADILREYYEKRPDLFHVIIERENQYSKNNPILEPLYEQAQGKYIAICEGDDYWTDPLKLQKQFDFLEKNKEYVMCFGQAITTFNKKKSKRYIEEQSKTIGYKEILEKNMISTLTSFYRREVIINYLQTSLSWKHKKWAMADYPLELFVASNGKVFSFADIFGAYRILPQSASHGNLKKMLAFHRSVLNIKLFFNNKVSRSFSSNKLIYDYCKTCIQIILSKKKYSRTAVCHYYKVAKRVNNEIESDFIINCITAYFFPFLYPIKKRLSNTYYLYQIKKIKYRLTHY